MILRCIVQSLPEVENTVRSRPQTQCHTQSWYEYRVLAARQSVRKMYSVSRQN